MKKKILLTLVVLGIAGALHALDLQPNIFRTQAQAVRALEKTGIVETLEKNQVTHFDIESSPNEGLIREINEKIARSRTNVFRISARYNKNNKIEHAEFEYRGDFLSSFDRYYVYSPGHYWAKEGDLSLHNGVSREIIPMQDANWYGKSVSR